MRRPDWFKKDFKPLGYTLRQAGSGHLKVLDPEGILATVLSATPSDPRGDRNARAHLRRWESRRRDHLAQKTALIVV
jgi:hypothetical protein